MDARGCKDGRRLVPEDLAFFGTLSKWGATEKFDPAFHVGGAISNAPDAKNLQRKARYQAVCPLS